jgi:biopolymer transport protein ExbD
VQEFTIKVEARQENGKPVIKVENQAVDVPNLAGAIKRWMKDTRKNNLLIDAAGVDWNTVVQIQDAAKGAGVNRIFYPVSPDEIRAKK